jgi:hypothetical protein
VRGGPRCTTLRRRFDDMCFRFHASESVLAPSTVTMRCRGARERAMSPSMLVRALLIVCVTTACSSSRSSSQDAAGTDVADAPAAFKLLGAYHGPAEDGVQCPHVQDCQSPYARCCYGQAIACAPATSAACVYSAIDCDGPEDCPAVGQVCCVYRASPSYLGAQCRATEDCGSPGEGTWGFGASALACNADVDCSGGQVCCSTATVSSFEDFGTGICLQGPC